MRAVEPGPASARGSAPAERAWAARWRAPFALLAIATDGHALTELHYRPLAEAEQAPRDAIAERTVRELERYIDDREFRFTVPLAPRGTRFRRRVWSALCSIAPGRTRTYGELARELGSVPRAVGQACGANPIGLIVPCHRVVAAHGALGGFMHCASGDPIAIKRWLLEHELGSFGLFSVAR